MAALQSCACLENEAQPAVYMFETAVVRMRTRGGFTPLRMCGFSQVMTELKIEFSCVRKTSGYCAMSCDS